MKDLLKVLLILGTILCVLSMLLGSCSTSKRAKPCTSCPHFSYIYYDTTILTIPHYNSNGMCFPEEKILLISEEEITIEEL